MFIYNFFNNISKNKDNIKKENDKEKEEEEKEERLFIDIKILNNFENNECVICLDNMIKGENVIIIKCGHKYHTKCLNEWFLRKKICPICDFLVK